MKIDIIEIMEILKQWYIMYNTKINRFLTPVLIVYIKDRLRSKVDRPKSHEREEELLVCSGVWTCDS